ncbi:olfactory receptor 2AP1-like [Pantherophis guttatus]|uniref:Olfactory receptor n=1 Tax=Pantherophis guttatus TaxID=94885 RepID=A0A6P9C8F4_PANGU|nr:olfactory receptor 2AP1-like [Pantherophis guttatus]
MEEILLIENGNKTSVREFILLGFGNSHQLQPFLSTFFLVIYLITITGNIFIFLLVLVDQQLHTPMYFFLANLSFLDTCYSCILLPKMLVSLLTGERTISVHGCLVQYHFVCLCGTTETYILAAMSYDRFLAICRPLHYASIMNKKLCFQLMAGAWINSLIFDVILVSFTTQLSFCGPNVIDDYFCDFRPLQKLSCTDTSLIELIAFCEAVIFIIVPFLLTIASYVCIIGTIIKIKSTTGRQKAFSTCSSHLLVVSLFYSTLIIVYVLPDTASLRPLNKIFSIFYTVMTSLFNPLIYTLRNKEVHKAVKRLFNKILIYHMNHLKISTSLHFISLQKFNCRF